MAQKEESHREAVDSMSSELVQVRRQYDELVVLSRDQVRQYISSGTFRTLNYLRRRSTCLLSWKPCVISARRTS